jgi:hypothetical protein
MIDLFSAELLAAAHKLPCPYCNVDPEQPCINKADGKPLRFAPPHIKRLRTAIAQMEVKQ